MVAGKCALCLKETILKLSHYLPAGIYRILRDKDEKNPHPWKITERSSLQTSKQLSAYLLCGDCEQRFDKNGENWVLRNCYKSDKTFPLAEILSSRKPDLSEPNSATKIYCASKIDGINISALAYFALSVFWRGSIYPWNNNGTIPVNFGPFQNSIRSYLLDLEGFPRDSALWVIVRKGAAQDLAYPPVGARTNNIHTYRFVIPGLTFILAVSKNITSTHRNVCIIHGENNPITFTSIAEDLIMNDVRAVIEKQQSK
jgi:hypothetical protein